MAAVSHPLGTFRRMGKNNRARRAAKAKARQQQRSSRHDAPRDRAHHEPDIDELVELAVHQLARGVGLYSVNEVRRLREAPEPSVHRAIEGSLARAVVALWASGWQPREVVRHARRTGGAATDELVRAAIAADHARRAPHTLHPQWAAQIEQLALPADVLGGATGWVAGWMHRHADDDRPAVITALEAIALLRCVPRLDELIPPPGASGAARAATPGADIDGVDRAVLDKVRALLTKAESTTFDAEAAAFTAKAHELMTRHAIDSAMLAAAGAAGHDRSAPTTIRLAIDDPYADAKSLLLEVIARANRCRSIFHLNLSMSSVIGYPADVNATELLYTSLLLQAQSALADAGRNAAAGARTRSRSFRSAFLVAYVHRIGQRLTDVTERLTAEAAASSGGSLLPVLHSREAAIDDHVREHFGRLVSRPIRGGHDPVGWARGFEAGDTADLADITHGRLAS